jgi:hypothetical protein
MQVSVSSISLSRRYNRWTDHERDAIFGELPDEEEQRRVAAEMPWVEDGAYAAAVGRRAIHSVANALLRAPTAGADIKHW